MTTSAILESVRITVNARHAAMAWVNAFLATSKDADRAMLYQTISVEVFEGRGVQFIATNGHVLFRTWVPSTTAPQGIATWPDARYYPCDRQLTVMDPDGFGVGFMKSLLRVTGAEGHADEPLVLTSSPVDTEAELSFGSEFQTERITLRACGQRIDLLVRQEAYPNWRGLKLGLDDLSLVDGMKVAPKYLALVGKLKDVSACDMTFAGSDRAIWLNAEGIEGHGVKGLVMPMRRLTTQQTSAVDDEHDGDDTDESEEEAAVETGGGNRRGRKVRVTTPPERTLAELRDGLLEAGYAVLVIDLDAWSDDERRAANDYIDGMRQATADGIPFGPSEPECVDRDGTTVARLQELLAAGPYRVREILTGEHGTDYSVVREASEGADDETDTTTDDKLDAEIRAARLNRTVLQRADMNDDEVIEWAGKGPWLPEATRDGDAIIVAGSQRESCESFNDAMGRAARYNRNFAWLAELTHVEPMYDVVVAEGRAD